VPETPQIVTRTGSMGQASSAPPVVVPIPTGSEGS
jgi:hypothetical protein